MSAVAPSSGVHHWPAQQRVHHGLPVANALASELQGTQRVLLLTTASLADSQIRAIVVEAIGPRLAAQSHAMRAHTPAEDAAAVARLIRDERIDSVVALGGGSVIDGAKVACFAAWNGLDDAAGVLAAAAKIQPPAALENTLPSPRIVAVPTTLSAAEFASHAGVTDLAAGRKHVFAHPMMVPRAVILDPAATLETPARLLLSSGVRAIDHAAERWCSIRPAPFSDAVSLQALQMLVPGLRALHAQPAELEARAACQYGAWLSIMGGWAGVPVGASHGIGYILGAARGVPHGITSCLTLPAVMQWNVAVNAARQQVLAEVVGGAACAAGALRCFITELDLPTRLSQLDIQGDAALLELAQRYEGGGPIATNPRTVRDHADLFDILRLAA